MSEILVFLHSKYFSSTGKRFGRRSSEIFIRVAVTVNTMLHAYLVVGVMACVLGVKTLFGKNKKHFRTRCAYLLRKRKAAYSAFEKLISEGEGLCVTQVLPSGKRYPNTLVLGENGISAHDLQKLLHFINNFVKPGRRVVLLDCMDYFIRENDFDEAVKFLHSLKDQIVLSESILLTTLDLHSISKREQSFIKREMDTII